MVSHVELESQFTFLFTRDYSLQQAFLCGLAEKNESQRPRSLRGGRKKGRGGGEKHLPLSTPATQAKDREKSGASKKAALVSFLARSKPKVPFPGFSLLRNQTETLPTQANEIIACAPNRRRVAATCFASITHGATCRRGTGHKVQVGVGYEKLGVGHYFLTR